MALETGTRIGVYEVTGKLGEGGMGEVYRAHDTTLDRDVALKVLSEAFTADPDRLVRFQREAKVLASLNHPNIGGIYGLEAAGESQALVLELIEGPTLADRIAEGPIPVEEALTIATQMADALEAAHEEGIVHRDLKPANVKVRPDGTVKVLDFGLAKAVHPEVGDGSGAENPTISLTGATQMGMVVGTAAYMAPEQAKGKPVDKRADIWAFGVVLLEMLGGKRVFDGETPSETLAAVMMKDPSWEVLPTDLPATLDNVLHRCLEKDPRKRVRDIGDVRLAMEGAFETAAATPTEASSAPTLNLWQQPVPLAVGALALVLVVGLSVWALTRSEPDLRLGRFAIPVPVGSRLNIGNVSHDLAVSPDGGMLAYLAGTSSDLFGPKDLLLRSLSDFTATTIAGGAALYQPFFSPDGQWVGFIDVNDQELRRVSVTGGSAIPICDLPATMAGASWGEDDTIIFGTTALDDGLWRVEASGGLPEQLTTPDAAQGVLTHSWPQILPGGQHVLFTMNANPVDDSQIAVLSLDTGEQKVVARGGFHARYIQTGHLVYGVGNTLRAMAFDLNRLETVGPPISVLDDVMTKASGAADFGVSQNGSLVYVPATAAASTGRMLVWVNRQGQEQELPVTPAAYESPRISPDGRYVAVEVRSENTDVQVYDLQRNTPTRLTFDAGNDGFPLWMPDGQRVLFRSNRDGAPNVYAKAADGTGQVERLTTSDENHYPDDLTTDGERLVFYINRGHADMEVIPVGPNNSAEEGETLVQTEFNEGVAHLSPDDRWMAYISNESGQFDVYVRPFPNVDDGRWQISRNGGLSPVWAPDGEELFFRDATSLDMMVVGVDTQSGFSPGNPTVLFEAPYRMWRPGIGRAFDVSPDGERFLMIKAGETQESGADLDIAFVQNWVEELKERVPTP